MTTFSCRKGAFLVVGLIALVAGCATGAAIVPEPVSEFRSGLKVAVFPVHNLTDLPAPVKEIESLFAGNLTQSGIPVLEDRILDEFMARHRVRYTGGLDEETALLLREETGAEAVLVSALEYFEEGTVPKIALHARLISTEKKAQILWTGSTCRTGHDDLGILYLGRVDDSRVLMEEAVMEITRSMAPEETGDRQAIKGTPPGKSLFPDEAYRSAMFDSEDDHTIAVTPFLNLSERPRAGEILPLHFVERMITRPELVVLEPGVVRQGLLKMRVTMENGLTLPHLELVTRATEADLVLTGTVFHYSDSRGPAGNPVVEFSVQIFEGSTKRIVWSSRSVNRGSDGVVFFDAGRKRTACGLAAGMVETTIERIFN